MTSSRFLAATLATLFIAGCVSAEPTYTADGRKGHVVSCTPAWTGGIVGAVASASTNWGTC